MKIIAFLQPCQRHVSCSLSFILIFMLLASVFLVTNYGVNVTIHGLLYPNLWCFLSLTIVFLDQIYSAAEAIENVMLKTCDEKKKMVSVLVPEAVIVKYGIGSITLNDASCEAVKNATHWVLTSHSTACGSTALTYAAAPMYRNNLNIEFDQGYLAGHKTK